MPPDGLPQPQKPGRPGEITPEPMQQLLKSLDPALLNELISFIRGSIKKKLVIESADIRSRNFIDSLQGYRLTPTNIEIWAPRMGKRKTVADAAYSATVEDYLIAYTSITAGRTVTLPTVATAKVGKIFIVKDESGGAAANNITVDGNGAETIDGAATKVINTNYGSTRIYCSGAAWFTF